MTIPPPPRWLLMTMIILAFLVLVQALARPAHADTRVWLFYGWGPPAWSSGIDQIAAHARQMHGVTSVHVLPYMNTQQAADEIMATPSSARIVVGGYSCGGNASLAVGQGLRGHRNVHLALLQPSIWCGQYPTTDNELYVQGTYSLLTAGLGAYRPPGSARRTIFIRRQQRHMWADTDPNYQNDVLYLIYAVAEGNSNLLANYLGQTTRYINTQGTVTTLRGR